MQVKEDVTYTFVMSAEEAAGLRDYIYSSQRSRSIRPSSEAAATQFVNTLDSIQGYPTHG